MTKPTNAQIRHQMGILSNNRFKLPLMMVVVFKTCLGEKLMLLDVKLFLGVKNISPLKISSKPESYTYVYT